MPRAVSEKLETRWETWKQRPTEESLSGLLEVAEPVLQAGYRSFAGGSGDPVLELEAKRLAVKAFTQYQPHKGANLQTYLLQQLQPLTRARHQRAQELYVPKMVWADMQNLKAAEEQLRDHLGREPSTGEIADETGLSIKRLTYLRKFRDAGIPESVLREKVPADFLGSTEIEETPFWVAAVYHELGPVDQLIFDYRTGAHGQPKLSNEEIAKKLNISDSAVSQRAARMSDRLRAGIQTGD